MTYWSSVGNISWLFGITDVPDIFYKEELLGWDAIFYDGANFPISARSVFTQSFSLEWAAMSNKIEWPAENMKRGDDMGSIVKIKYWSTTELLRSQFIICLSIPKA